jgi:hypothetical protein
MAILSLIIAACVVTRIAFQFLPNVQPLTDIFLITALYFGAVEGESVAILAMLVTGLYLGMGPWVVGQCIAYAILILITVMANRVLDFNKQRYVFVGYTFGMGLMYGLIYAGFQVTLLQMNAFVPYYVAGLPFDLMHAFGNAVFAILFIQLDKTHPNLLAWFRI